MARSQFPLDPPRPRAKISARQWEAKFLRRSQLHHRNWVSRYPEHAGLRKRDL